MDSQEQLAPLDRMLTRGGKYCRQKWPGYTGSDLAPDLSSVLDKGPHLIGSDKNKRARLNWLKVWPEVGSGSLSHLF